MTHTIVSSSMKYDDMPVHMMIMDDMMPMLLLLQTPMDMVADITNLPISITMPQESTPKFDEKILYKTHRHAIVPVLKSIQYSL